MENFSKNTVKSAVSKYGPLHTDGKAEADVKAELAKDERGFTPEQIDEIYAAIVAPDVEQTGLHDGQMHIHISETSSSDEPAWVEKILLSNEALIKSNDNVIAALESLKSFASGRSKVEQTTFQQVKLDVNPDAKYVVADGKTFADRDDITKKYEAGDDVTELGTARLQVLLNSGLIEEA